MTARSYQIKQGHTVAILYYMALQAKPDTLIGTKVDLEVVTVPVETKAPYQQEALNLTEIT